GYTGWAYRTHLTGNVPAAQPIKHAEPTKPSTPAKPRTPAKDDAPIHTTSDVNVRTAPSPTAKAITALAQGTGARP
ncbi:hypothetical protein AK828_08440, partial [Cutibacterium acnes]